MKYNKVKEILEEKGYLITYLNNKAMVQTKRISIHFQEIVDPLKQEIVDPLKIDFIIINDWTFTSHKITSYKQLKRLIND